ncbi:hypothetical protein P7K49_025264 [Saguinus oedipus]|uniref:Uncharacterized protein n=1 Tax=Saguinus oedipus TaxID=9490 RepID=A0ABQ9UGR1_SAGOE|nr:hypothetical protein P7K49_025264 [Saguinus oedipus]
MASSVALKRSLWKEIITANLVKPSIVLTPQFLSHDQGQLTKELQQHVKSVPSPMQVPEEGEWFVPELHKIVSSMIKQGKLQKKQFVQM